MHAALGASGADTPRITGKNKPRRASKLISRAHMLYGKGKNKPKLRTNTRIWDQYGADARRANPRRDKPDGGRLQSCRGSGSKTRTWGEEARGESIPAEGRSSYSPARDVVTRSPSAPRWISTPPPRTTPRAAEEPAPRRRAGGHLDRPTGWLAAGADRPVRPGGGSGSSGREGGRGARRGGAGCGRRRRGLGGG
jgi:hypothetical protein